jgi:hypothetical protein
MPVHRGRRAGILELVSSTWQAPLPTATRTTTSFCKQLPPKAWVSRSCYGDPPPAKPTSFGSRVELDDTRGSWSVSPTPATTRVAAAHDPGPRSSCQRSGKAALATHQMQRAVVEPPAAQVLSAPRSAATHRALARARQAPASAPPPPGRASCSRDGGGCARSVAVRTCEGWPTPPPPSQRCAS